MKPNKISSYSLPRAGFFSALENLNSRKDVVEISELNFSQRVRNELARVKPTHPSCKWAELFGLIQTIGTLNISTRGPSLEIKTENAAVARKAVTLFKELGQMDSELIVEKETKLKKRNLYRIRVVKILAGYFLSLYIATYWTKMYPLLLRIRNAAADLT